MLKNLKMGAKLIAVLLAPVVVLVVLAAIGVNERQAEADQASGVARLTELAGSSTALIHELQLEAMVSASFMAVEGTDPALVDAMTAQRAATDKAAAAYRQAVANTPIDVSTVQGKDLEAATAQAETRVKGLEVTRRSVDDIQVTTSVARDNYAEAVRQLLTVNAEVANNAQNPALANQLRDLVLLGNYKATSSEIDALLAGVTKAGRMEEAELVELSGDADSTTEHLLEERTRRQQQFTDLASANNKALLRNISESAVNAAIIEIASTPIGQPLTISNDEWTEIGAAHLDGLFVVETNIIKETLDQAGTLRSDAESERNLFLLGTLAAVAFALFVALIVSRATTRPLRQLTDAAYELSNEKLPSLVDQLRNPQAGGEGQLRLQLDAIEIDSRDEVGLLAEAFNAIQRVTIDVAEEQAGLLRKGIGDIFINLARRNQNILDRQIEFIDMLEAKEEDPDQLDNLFKLDHLATRMRRNAESLLVLAGAEPPRRRGRPVELADVIRVAIGEVEDFARISLIALDDVAVEGNVAVDLAHLLSEFMENATHFSPPDTQVEVLGRWSRDGEGSASYTIAVTDQGIGMSAEQMAEANHLLAHPPLVGLALSRSLGFIVIARLAERLGITVSLESAPTGGVSALVVLPSTMVKVEGQDAPSVLDDAPAPASRTDEAVVNIEPYEPVAYEEPPAALEEPPAYEPATYESADDDLAELPTDEDFDRGLADLLGDEPMAPESDLIEPVVEEDRGLPTRDVSAGLPVRDVAPEPEPEPEPAAVEERSLPTSEADNLAGLPTREPAPVPAASEPEPMGAPAGGLTTSAGLVKRTPKEKQVGAGTSAIGGGIPTAGGASRSTAATQRSPEEVRKMLSRYRAGVKKDPNATDSKGDGE